MKTDPSMLVPACRTHTHNYTQFTHTHTHRCLSNTHTHTHHCLSNTGDYYVIQPVGKTISCLTSVSPFLSSSSPPFSLSLALFHDLFLTLFLFLPPLRLSNGRTVCDRHTHTHTHSLFEGRTSMHRISEIQQLLYFKLALPNYPHYDEAHDYSYT